MKVFTLTNEQLELAKNHIGTEYTCITDGCLCGDWEVKLSEDLFLTLYRSCRKSNSTPNGQQWAIDNAVYLYSRPLDDRWEEEDEYHKSIMGKLDRFQTKILRGIAGKTTESECGYNIYGESI